MSIFNKVTTLRNLLGQTKNSLFFQNNLKSKPWFDDTNQGYFYKNSGNTSFKKGNPQLFFVGNLFEYKNIQFLINIFPKIIQNYPDIHFQIVGKGEFKDNLIKLSLGKKRHIKVKLN